MTLIEGVGDEVTNFFIIAGVLLVSWIAWCSTSISDQPLIRTVLILHQHTRIRIAEFRSSINNNNNNSSNVNNNQQTSEQQQQIEENATEATEENGSSENDNLQSRHNAAVNEEMLIEAMDSANEQVQEIVPTTEQENRPEEVEFESLPEGEPISVKLKFINDDQKLVTANLKEALGDFKRRNFKMELESQKVVRLVFKGNILQPDTLTLEHCGLFNNCVVHCLVLQQRQPQQQSLQQQAQQQNSENDSSTIYYNPHGISGNNLNPNQGNSPNEWDLSRMLVGVLVFILGLAWYSRFHYAQLFTATTTIALYALTAIFTVSIFSHFYPDQENVRNNAE